nr:diaminobutyrate acetyltransferase [Paenalcaligenes hominis]
MTITKTETKTTNTESSDEDPLRFHQPTINDGAAIYELVQACPPLDLNSNYVYLLLSTHFAQTCIVAYDADQLVGFISAYRHPQKKQTLFIWQVAVHATMRGRGVAQKMLDVLLDREGLEDIKFIETTVDPDNSSSRRLFEKLAQRHQAQLTELEFLIAEHFVKPQVEPLLRIGPLTTNLL